MVSRYRQQIMYNSYFSLADRDLSLPSLPVSEVAFEGLGPVSPSPPLRMIFIIGTTGGGVLPDVGGFDTAVRDGGSRQKGVLKIRTVCAAVST